MKFEELTLSPNILSGLRDLNYTELTELQEAVLPPVFDGADVLVKAAEGNSKNASFVIPALEKASAKEQNEGASVLILTPASKTLQDIDKLLSEIGRSAEVEYARVDIDDDAESHEEALSSGAEVIVAHPSPLQETMQNLRFIFRHIDLLVIDGADEIISQNLISQVNNIDKRIMSEHQTIIFTGGFNGQVQELANNFLDEPLAIGLDGQPNSQMLSEPPKVTGKLSQGYIHVPNRMKITTLMAHVEESGDDRCVIFTASKRGTDRLYRIFRKRNFKATSLHGKLSDEKRAQRFANFTNGDIQFLLVSDISAAELDLQQVKQVINYDVPNDANEYRYRASLVGSGKATRLVSLVSKQDRSDINELKNELGQAPQEIDLPAKVKQKLDQRKKNKNQRGKHKKQSKKRSSHKKRSNGRGKKQQKKKEMELPRPSFDKLSGGRTGNEKQDTKSGVIGLIKKLFS